MLIEFDAEKDAANTSKHGVSLAEAEGFNWQKAVVQPARVVSGELRYRVLGLIEQIVFVAIVTPREDRMRIISLRRANRREREAYGQGS